MTILVTAAFALDTQGQAPEFIHILPYGPFVVARDGRAFQVTDATSVARRSELPMLLDWEHDSEKWNGSTEAAGWGEELLVENGSGGRAAGVWMRTAWTPEGASDVISKKYRYLSPVLVLDPETRDVQEIVSVALTNKPALRMEQIGKFRETGIDAHRAHIREVRAAFSVVAAPKPLTAEQYIADRRAAAQRGDDDATVDEACMRAGLSAEQIAAARRYHAERRERAARGA